MLMVHSAHMDIRSTTNSYMPCSLYIIRQQTKKKKLKQLQIFRLSLNYMFSDNSLTLHNRMHYVTKNISVVKVRTMWLMNDNNSSVLDKYSSQ